jgi:hypothetical protein
MNQLLLRRQSGGATRKRHLVKRGFLPLIFGTCLWVLSLPCSADNVGVTREELLPDSSIVFTFSNGNRFILQPGQDPSLVSSVLSLQQKGGTVPPEAVKKWQKQMQYNAAYKIPSRGRHSVVWTDGSCSASA